jgi:hypothetical protein
MSLLGYQLYRCFSYDPELSSASIYEREDQDQVAKSGVRYQTAMSAYFNKNMNPNLPLPDKETY